MTLNVKNHPRFVELKSELEDVGNNPRLDHFFWLKAVEDGPTGFRIFRDKNPHPEQKVFRIANIVLQGGGVLGLAHAGFVAGLELAGVRFAGIAGASAGAIMAMGMAAARGDRLLQETHEKVIDIVGGMPMGAFIDGPFRTRRLIKQYLLKRLSFGPSAWFAWLGALRQIRRKRGLNPGNAFEDWLRGALAELGVRTVEDLQMSLQTIGEALTFERSRSDIKIRSEWQLDGEQGVGRTGEDLLQIMAASSPVGVKFQFPRDIRYLSSASRSNSPAALVRASMSIPLFFEPATFDVDKASWPAFIIERLKDFVDEDKLTELSKIDQVAFLDGGIFSNLPVDAFSTVLADVPTVAVPLVSGKLAKPYQRRARLKSLAEDIGTVAFMVRNLRDRDAVEHLRRARIRFDERKNVIDRTEPKATPPSHPFRLAAINVEDANWLNFVMDDTDMMKLFLIGFERADKFLKLLLEEAPSP